jgi:DNA primase
MPLRWEEVNDSLDPRTYTIRTAIDRMASLGIDPVLGAVEERPDLHGVLEKLSAVLSANAERSDGE